MGTNPWKEHTDKYNDKEPVTKYKVGDRFITRIDKLIPGRNGNGYYMDYMLDTDPNISEKEDYYCGGWLTRQEILDGMIYLGGRLDGEEPAKNIIEKLNCSELKAALWRAVQKMESALKCTNCPVYLECKQGAPECRVRILEELLRNDDEKGI